jgi:hypothetical protein
MLVSGQLAEELGNGLPNVASKEVGRVDCLIQELRQERHATVRYEPCPSNFL